MSGRIYLYIFFLINAGMWKKHRRSQHNERRQVPVQIDYCRNVRDRDHHQPLQQQQQLCLELRGDELQIEKA